MSELAPVPPALQEESQGANIPPMDWKGRLALGLAWLAFLGGVWWTLTADQRDAHIELLIGAAGAGMLLAVGAEELIELKLGGRKS